jgi:signal peptidase I
METSARLRAETTCELVTEVANRFGEVRLKVTGASMLPAIWPGDVLTAQRTVVAALRPGQIVLCRRQDQLVAHRIIGAAYGQLITRGDTLPQDDPPVGLSDIVGHVVSIERNGRLVNMQWSLRQRVGASILRHSDFCSRMTLRIGRSLRRLKFREMSWAS